MTTADAIPNDRAVPPDRRWDATLLTQQEQGRRNRRTIDSVSVGAAAIVIGLTAVVASSAAEQDAAVEQAVATVFGWAEAFWRVAFFATLGLSLVVVVVVLVRRRWSLARDLLAAVGILLAATSILGRTVEADWFPVEAHMLSRWGYPELRLAAATAVFVVPHTRSRRERPGAVDEAARRLRAIRRPRHDRPRPEGSAPGTGRGGHATRRQALAPARVPGPASQCCRGATRAGGA